MDRMEVIKALSDFSKNGICLPHLIPWKEINAAIAMLNEMEPVKPKKDDAWASAILVCGACGSCLLNIADYKAKFCFECGRPVKWR